LGIRVNRHIEFPTQNFEPANVIAMFVSEQDAVELVGQHAALLEPEGDLARAQSAVDQDFAVIGRDQSAVSGTAAAEQSQTEHAGI
jgi:hypothetical protein